MNYFFYLLFIVIRFGGSSIFRKEIYFKVYYTSCNVLLDNEMIGDTINIFIESTFNTDGGVYYHGSDELVPKEIIENNLKVIIK